MFGFTRTPSDDAFESLQARTGRWARYYRFCCHTFARKESLQVFASARVVVTVWRWLGVQHCEPSLESFEGN